MSVIQVIRTGDRIDIFSPILLSQVAFVGRRKRPETHSLHNCGNFVIRFIGYICIVNRNNSGIEPAKSESWRRKEESCRGESPSLSNSRIRIRAEGKTTLILTTIGLCLREGMGFGRLRSGSSLAPSKRRVGRLPPRGSRSPREAVGEARMSASQRSGQNR